MRHPSPARFPETAHARAVLVDKPITATVAEAQELGALAQSRALVLYAYQNRRWDSDFLALRRLLALPPSSPHSLGTIVEFESQSVPFPSPHARR